MGAIHDQIAHLLEEMWENLDHAEHPSYGPPGSEFFFEEAQKNKLAILELVKDL